VAKNFSNQVSDGMDVFDANDDKIGTVHEVYDAAGAEKSSSGGGYLRVPTGFLGLGTEHHIPFSTIHDVRDSHIHLNVAKDRLDEMGYDAAPMEADDHFDGTTIERTTTTTTQAQMPGAQAPGPRAGDDGARKLQLREEELIARKRSVETETVGIRTEVVSEQRTLEVPVTREEVTIERHAVDRRPSDRPIAEGETISIPVREEEVTLEKKAVVYEEVNIGKRAVEDTEHVSGTVRREEAVINEEGDVKIEGDSTTKPAPRRP
jgi:uncharacterized protein (TIGR02271 family)